MAMSRAPLSHDTDDFTGVLVSTTTSGKPLTHKTTSNLRSLPGEPNVTSSETTKVF